MRLRIISWKGDTTIASDGAIFKAYLPDEATGIFSQTGNSPAFLKETGSTPVFLGTTIGEWYFPIKIIIVGTTDELKSSGRDTLAQYFPTTAERNQEGVLIAKDIDDGDREWQITGAPVIFQYRRDFVSIVLAVAEPRWIEVDEISDTDAYTTGNGVTLDPEPKGNTEYAPILEITPSTARVVANTGEEIREFIEVVNPVGQPALEGFAIDLSNGGWNHAADVATSDSLANGDDIRVKINGQTINRWIEDADSTSAKLWTHINLGASKVLKLKTALSSGGSETEVVIRSTEKQRSLLKSMPTSGQFKIGTERFTYRGKSFNATTAKYKFTNVKRGVLQSSKAAHSTGDSITWIPNKIWVFQGNTTVTEAPNTYDVDDFKPAFNLSTSTNTSWIYDTLFFNSVFSRSWGFVNIIAELSPSPDNVNVGETTIFTANQYTFADPASVIGQRIAASNDLYTNGNFRATSASLAATLEIPFGIKAVTVEGRKARNGAEWVAEHSLWYTRNEGEGWLQKWNDSTLPSNATGTWENLGAGIEATLHTLDASDGYSRIMFLQKGAISGGATQNWDAWQIDKATIDFNSGEVPVITNKFAGTSTGVAVVEIRFVITNSATSDSIEVNTTIPLSGTLVLDFQEFDFYILSNNEKQALAVRPTDGIITGHWFMLKGGEANTITITDANMPTTSMKVRWNARHI